VKSDGNDLNRLNRRDFIRVGTAGATGIAPAAFDGLAAPAQSSAGPAAKLPRRRYGRTGLTISTLVGV